MRCCVTIILLLIYSHGYSQIELIRQSYENAPLDSILIQLNRQYGLKYAYQSEDVDSVLVSWSYRGNNLNEAMVSLFTPLDLEYKIVRDDFILIRDKQHTVQSSRFLFRGNGIVWDGEEEEPLAFAQVLLPNGHWIYTDEKGKFSFTFTLDEKEAWIEASFLSFSTQKMKVVSDSHNELRFVLYPFTQKLEPVTVLANKPVISRKAERPDVWRLTPSFDFTDQGFNDPLAALQVLPGISNFKESGGLLNIRGGGDFDNFLLLDGLPLYKVDHFFGYFSALSSNVVEEIDVYKNAFPSRFGGKSASVIDVRSKTLENEWQGSVDLSWLYTSAAIEFPINDNFQVFAGLRFNNVNLANDYFSDYSQQISAPGRLFLERNPGIVHSREYIPDFSFYDLYFKLQYKFSEHSRFMINYFRGEDDFKNRIVSDYVWRASPDRFRLTESFIDRNEWQNSGLSLQWEREWSPYLESSFSFASSGHRSGSHIEYNIQRIAMDVNADTSAQMMYNEVSGLFLYLDNRYRISANHSLDFGLQLSGERASVRIISDERPSLIRKDDATVSSLYYEYNGSVGDFSLQAGMRHNYYQATRQLYHSPRVLMRYNWTPDFYTKASWSIYQQFVRQLYHDSPTGRSFALWVLANDNQIPLLERQHFMLGAGWLWNRFSLDIEAYDIRSSGELEHALSLIGFDPVTGTPRFDASPILYQGEGKTRGVDIYVKWHSDNFQPFLSYTLSKSTVAFEGINEGQEILSQNDRRHQLSVGASFNTGNWEFRAQYHYATGRPYTNLTRFKNDPRDRRGSIALREDRLPDYSRMDISSTYTFSFKDSKLKCKGSIFNLFDRQNVKYYQYMYNVRQPENEENFVLGFDQPMLGILPNLTLSYEF